MARDERERQKTDIGYINITWNGKEGCWQIGGNFTDGKGKEFDLGFCKVGTTGLQDGIALVAKQLGPTLNGKGIERQRRQSKDDESGGGYR
jgi:hypothetical protein